VALALVLRHSWFPEDLAHIIAEPGLSPSPTSPAVSRGPSSDVIDVANRRGLTNHSAHICTPQKGEERRC
jgi:hypothetical protein